MHDIGRLDYWHENSLENKPEPSALQKKLTRKRQRQELADAIVGQANSHGIAEDDGESEGESKTASFKGKKKENQTTMSVGQRYKADNGRASNEKRKESDDNGQDMGGEKNSRKHKARRKKRKVKEAGGEGDVGGEEPQSSAENVITPAEQPPIVERRDQSGDATEAPDQETRKQRRGWGKKGPSKPSEVAQDSEAKSRLEDNTVHNENTEGRLRRKKKRSRQKNIRKDKRSFDQRPAHLRVGDPEFSGRTLTPATRKVLGLPADEIDANFQ